MPSDRSTSELPDDGGATDKDAEPVVRFCCRVLDQGCLDEQEVAARFDELAERFRRGLEQPGAVQILLDGRVEFSADDELLHLAAALCFDAATSLSQGGSIARRYSESSYQFSASSDGEYVLLDDGLGRSIRLRRSPVVELLFDCGVRIVAHLRHVAEEQPDLARELLYVEPLMAEAARVLRAGGSQAEGASP